MNCKKCGTFLSPEDLFCKGCGTSVAELKGTGNVVYQNTVGQAPVFTNPAPLPPVGPMPVPPVQPMPAQPIPVAPVQPVAPMSVQPVQPVAPMPVQPMPPVQPIPVAPMPAQPIPVTPMPAQPVGPMPVTPVQPVAPTPAYTTNPASTFEAPTYYNAAPSNGGQYYNPNSYGRKRGNNLVTMILGIIIIVMLAVGSYFVFFKDQKEFNTTKIVYENYEFSIPNKYTHEATNDGLILVDGDFKVSLHVETNPYSYYVDNMDDLIAGMGQDGLTVSKNYEKTYGGLKAYVFEIKISNNDALLILSKAAATETFVVGAAVDGEKAPINRIDGIATILKSAKKNNSSNSISNGIDLNQLTNIFNNQ